MGQSRDIKKNTAETSIFILSNETNQCFTVPFHTFMVTLKTQNISRNDSGIIRDYLPALDPHFHSLEAVFGSQSLGWHNYEPRVYN